MFGGWRLTRAGIIFFIGVVVLAGLVFGGVYLVHQRGEQARRSEAVKIAEQNLEKQSEVATQPTNSGTTTSEETNKAESTPTNTTTTHTTTELPQTGANPFSVIVVAFLAFSSALYISSRRAVRATLDL